MEKHNNVYAKEINLFRNNLGSVYWFMMCFLSVEGKESDYTKGIYISENIIRYIYFNYTSLENVIIRVKG